MLHVSVWLALTDAHELLKLNALLEKRQEMESLRDRIALTRVLSSQARKVKERLQDGIPQYLRHIEMIELRNKFLALSRKKKKLLPVVELKSKLPGFSDRASILQQEQTSLVELRQIYDSLTEIQSEKLGLLKAKELTLSYEELRQSYEELSSLSLRKEELNKVYESLNNNKLLLSSRRSEKSDLEEQIRLYQIQLDKISVCSECGAPVKNGRYEADK